MNARLPILLAVLAACLAGCVSQGPFPSLALRPAEREDWTEEPVHVPPVVADDMALRTRIAALTAEARQGDRAFNADLAGAQRATAHPAAPGSDSWNDAQQAISRLQASRGKTDEAAAELHQIQVSRSGQPTSADDVAALEAGIREVGEMVERQQRLLDRINRL